MAVGPKVKKKNSMLTKTGKTKLGPLSITQLQDLLKSARKKHIPKIQKAIARKSV
jgi:hypothetical protein